MTKHEVITYEAFDGTMFDDELKCLKYELKRYYEMSGIRFIHRNGRPYKTFENDLELYDIAWGVTVDRTKQKENEIFIDKVIEGFGWSLLEELRKSDATKYKFTTTELKPYKTGAMKEINIKAVK